MRPTIASLLRASRPMADGFGKRISSKEEEIGFTKVFRTIIGQKGDKPDKAKNMQLVLESLSSLAKGKPKQQIFSPSRASTNTSAKPVNMFGKFRFDKDIALKTFDDLEKKNKLEFALATVFDEMSELKSNYELIQYLKDLIRRFEKVLSRDDFKPSKFDADLLEKIKEDPNGSLNELTFPLIMLKGLTLLSEEFDSKLEALNLIQYLKNQNLKIYFFGLTTDIFNINLKLEWQSYGDLNKINAIIDEFKINGIQSNISTLQILRKISSEYHQATNPDYHALDDKTFNPGLNKQDELDMFQIDQHVKDLVSVHR